MSGSQRSTTGAVHYWHQDHLGSSSVITDGAGAVVQTLAYYPYGATRTNQSSANPAVDVPYKYTGKELDSTTGLYYYEARYYDPTLGRYISADTIVPNPRDPQDSNRYTYAGNNPFKYADPTGHFKLAKVLDRIFKNKEIRIAGWVLFPPQMVFVDPATRRYAVPAAAGAAGAVGCAFGGPTLSYVCAGAAAGAASALVSQSEGRGGNVGRSTLAGAAGGAAAYVGGLIPYCSLLCGGAAGGATYAAVMGQDPGRGAGFGALAALPGFAISLYQSYYSSTVSTSQGQDPSSALNVDQSPQASPVANLGGSCITPGGGTCLVGGKLHQTESGYTLEVFTLREGVGPVGVDIYHRPVLNPYVLDYEGRLGTTLLDHIVVKGVTLYPLDPPAAVYGQPSVGYIDLRHGHSQVFRVPGYNTDPKAGGY